MSHFIKQNSCQCSFATSESWVVLSSIEQSIKQKIEKAGTPLKDWDINIYRGVLTGFNDAFIISSQKREEILNNCKTEEERKKTDELIRPILRGRDIKRYGYDWAGLYLVYIPWHFPLHKDNTIQGASEKAEKEFQKQYPAVYGHLLNYKKELSARNKAETGIRYEWYALQRWGANYSDDFFKQRIIYREIGEEMDACLIPKGIVINNKLYMVSGENLEFLIIFFNSSLFNKIILQTANLTGGKGVDFMDKINVIKPTNQDILKAKELLASSDDESKDDFINSLYRLSEEEINFIKSSITTK